MRGKNILYDKNVALRSEQETQNQNIRSRHIGEPLPAPIFYEIEGNNGQKIAVALYGDLEESAKKQLEICLRTGTAYAGALMADHHKGYSQPIGGVTAYLGQITPSGVGYDISCLKEGTPVLTQNGYYKNIEEITKEDSSLCWDSEKIRRISPCLGNVKKGRKETFSLSLEDSSFIEATADHQIMTQEGWKELKDIKEGDYIASSSYKGLPYEKSDKEIVLNIRKPRTSRCMDIEKDLQERQLYPLHASHPHLPLILRLLAYNCGDGHLHKDGKSVTWYTFNKTDANSIWNDLIELGFVASIYERQRNSSIEYCVKVASVSLHALFEALGAPVGKKIDNWQEKPMRWLFELPKYLQAQFLSSFAAAEATVPVYNKSSFANLAIKQAGTDKKTIHFIQEIFSSLGFETSVAPSGIKRENIQDHVLLLLGGGESLIKFCQQIGFCYSIQKRIAAAEVTSVFWQRYHKRQERQKAYDKALALKAANIKPVLIKKEVAEEYGVSINFVDHALYGRGEPRLVNGQEIKPITSNEIVWMQVKDIYSTGINDVYDVLTDDEAHNFIANGVVVHNCGVKGVKTNIKVEDIDVSKIMDRIEEEVAFGVGQKNKNASRYQDHPVLDKIREADFDEQQKLLDMAASQLGTVGSGNHYVNLLEDEEGYVWISAHFGSRGFGHTTADGFLALNQNMPFSKQERKRKGLKVKEGEMDSPPVLFDTSSDIGQAYISAMQLAGDYAYAGRDVVCQQVLDILGAKSVKEVHEHHNYAWKEEHNGQELWVARKGATPAFPGQEGVIGGSMAGPTVIVEGLDNPESIPALFSTVHGAGRVMSRTQAAGKKKWEKVYFCGSRKCGRQVSGPHKGACKHHPSLTPVKSKRPRVVRPGVVDFAKVKEDLREKGIELRGAGADEAPEVYKDLDRVLQMHDNQIRVKTRLMPIGVAMAGEGVIDPYKD